MVGRFILLLVVAVAACGCDEDKDPESIPFEGIDPSAKAKRPKPLPRPTVTASATATPKPTPKPLRSAVRLQSCCLALRAAARTGDEGQRAVNKQAAAVCSQKLRAVRDGKLPEATALSQVRSSLLGRAPAVCR